MQQTSSRNIPPVFAIIFDEEGLLPYYLPFIVNAKIEFNNVLFALR